MAGKFYGNYCMFLPGTSEEEVRETTKAAAADMLEKMGALKIIVNMDPQPVDNPDGTVSFFVHAGWKIRLPEPPEEGDNDAE